MKKIILLLFLLTHINHTLFSMDLVKLFSPHSSREKIQKSIPAEIKESFKTDSLPELLRIIHRVKKNFNITESDLSTLALGKKNRTIKHQYLFLQMKRIENYNNKIKEEKKLCPALSIYSNFDTVISFYKEYREARLCAKSCGIYLSKKQQRAAMPHPNSIDPQIAFEEFIDLEMDLNYLKANPLYFYNMIAMITASEIKTDATVTLESDTATGGI